MRERHGATGTKLYRAWQNVKDRCENPKNPAFHNYGGRGVRIAPVWSASFLAFREAVGEPPTPLHTLERVDNSGDYAPGNVRWATRKEQAQNLRKNRLLTFAGRTQPLTAWAEEIGLVPSTLHYRLDQAGMTVAEALTTPRRGGRRPGG